MNFLHRLKGFFSLSPEGQEIGYCSGLAQESVASPAFIILSEVEDASQVVGDLFQRKFNASPPNFPRHFVAFYKRGANDFIPVSYVHCWKNGDVYLVGGACTDGRVLRQMSKNERAAIRVTPGVYYFILRYAFSKLKHNCVALFGYCGDTLALKIDLKAGFRETDEPNILIYTPRPTRDKLERKLIKEVAALGPF